MKILQAQPEGHHVVEGLADSSHVDTLNIRLPWSQFIAYYVIRGRYDILHIQFLQPRFQINSSPIVSIFWELFFLLQLCFLRLIGVSIVWTAHHTQSHETLSPRLDYWGRQAVILLSSHLFVLEPPMVQSIQANFKVRCPITVARLGNYRTYHERRADKLPTIELPNNQPIVSMVGKLRKYKRVPLGIRVCDTSERTGSMFIGGSPSSASREQEIRAQVSEATVPITLALERLPHQDMIDAVERSDAILILNDQESVPATALLAGACKTPIVTTPGGVKEYLVTEYEMGTVAESESVAAISTALDTLLEEPPEADWEAFLTDHTWSEYTEKHLSVYRSIV